jgi:hypothetical protein
VADRDQIKKLWRFLHVDHLSVIELRAFLPDGCRTQVRHYDARTLGADQCQCRFEEDAVALNDQGFNVYVVMNPINPEAKMRNAARDKDIIGRRLLLVDIDRATGTDQPATAEDIARAEVAAEVVRLHVAGWGWEEPVAQVMSGNGVHLYWRLACWPNTDESRDVVKGVLRQLAALIDDEHVRVDQNVANASRITKVPGTIMRKGQESEGRPFRLAVVRDS